MSTLKHQMIPLEHVKFHDGFLASRAQLVRDVVIPYQWEALNDRIEGAEPSGCIRNLRIASGELEGEFAGMVFQDSDVAKWLEAVGNRLATHPDPAMEAVADEVIALIGKAQQPDGYLNTYFTVKEPGRRWTNLLDCHELYCAGHMIEAAVAYFEGTGKRAFLDMMCRFADYIGTVFGREEGQLQGYDGHEEIELALMKLWRVTGEDRYLTLACFFVDARGTSPNFLLEDWKRRDGISHWTGRKDQGPDLKYHQAHVPVREQREAVGHAVRAVYLYTAMADIARETGDESLLEACRCLWKNIVEQQMYITGGIGQTHHGEAFTFGFDLPNDTVYQETCASIGLIFFAWQMLMAEPHHQYGDIMEQALYNSVLSGMAADGRHFFYVNPLEVWPEASAKDPGKRHVCAERPAWYGCACCPPNVARLLTSAGRYLYTVADNKLFMHHYAASVSDLEIGGRQVRITQETAYPLQGDIRVRVETGTEEAWTLSLRIPGWSRQTNVRINGVVAGGQAGGNGYLEIRRYWKSGDCVEISLDMEPRRVYADVRVRENAGKAALMRGPLVYCTEEADHAANLPAWGMVRHSAISESEERVGDMLVPVLKVPGWREKSSGCGLYQQTPPQKESTELRAVPYALWGNRGGGEMMVWHRVSE